MVPQNIFLQIPFICNLKKNWRVAPEIIEKRIKGILLIKSHLILEIGLEIINARSCPICGKVLSNFENQKYIFCSAECIKSAELKFVRYLNNDVRLKFKKSNKEFTINKLSFDVETKEIPVIKILNTIIDWLSFESYDNVADVAISNLVDDYIQGKISRVVGKSIETFTVINLDLTKLILKNDPQVNLIRGHQFPINTPDVVKLLSKISKNEEVDKFLVLISRKKFLNSNNFIDAFTLCYFGASSDLITAVGNEIFLNAERFKSWIRNEISGNVDEFIEFVDQMSFAAPCLDFWPNMSILINPWINFPSALTIRDGSQRKYFAQLIISITKNFKSESGGLHNWLKEIVYFNFEIDAPKGSKARRRYSETFGVSRERARQMSLPSQPLSDYLRGFQKEMHEIGVLEFKDQLSKYILSHPGSTSYELNDLFSIDHTLTKWLNQKYGHLILIELDPNNELTRDVKRIDVLESLRNASTLHWPLTTKNYQELLDAGFIDGLSSQRILQIYGTWKNACDEANVECGETLRDAYTRDFSADECISFVGEYLMDENCNGTAGGYLSWREHHQMPDRVPSIGTLLNRLHRSWVVIVRLALEKLRDRWFYEDLKESSNGL